MDVSTRALLLASLPDNAAAPIRAIFAGGDQPSDLAATALEIVGYPPRSEIVPLVSVLSAAQRAVVRLLADVPRLGLAQFALPMTQTTRRRWLGLDDATVMEREVDSGDQRTPLWRALRIFEANKRIKERDAFFRSLDLSLVERMDAFIDHALGSYHFNINFELPRPSDAELGELGGWATKKADELLELLARGEIQFWRSGRNFVPQRIALPVLLAVVRCGGTIEPRWDVFVEPSVKFSPDVHQILGAVPEPRRTAVIMASLEPSPFANAVVETGVTWLPHFPSEAITRLVLERSEKADVPKRQLLTQLKAIAREHELVRRALPGSAEPRAITLSVASATAVRDEKALTPAQKKQVAAAREAYEEDLSFEGTLKILKVVDAKKKPAFDVLTYLGGDGCVFVANTTKMVGQIIQHSLQCEDAALRDALQTALAKKNRAE